MPANERVGEAALARSLSLVPPLSSSLNLVHVRDVCCQPSGCTSEVQGGLAIARTMAPALVRTRVSTLLASSRERLPGEFPSLCPPQKPRYACGATRALAVGSAYG